VLQVFPCRDFLTGIIIPVSLSLRGNSCRRWLRRRGGAVGGGGGSAMVFVLASFWLLIRLCNTADVSFENCVGATGDQEACRTVQRVFQLVKELSLVECVERRKVKKCFDACLDRCGGEECVDLCIGALDVAVGLAVARGLAEGAKMVALFGVSPAEAAAAAFAYMLQKAGRTKCPERADAARILNIVAVELRNLLGAQDLLLLLAPAVAVVHSCIGDEAFDVLDAIMSAVGEETTARIAAALEEGVVAVGNVVVKFPPVKTNAV